MKRPRPHIPIEVKLQVAERQLGRTWAIRGQSRTERLDLVLRLLFEREAYALDHDPPLAARPYDPNVKDTAARYTPNANDPEFLIYRKKEDHRIKTYVRGEHGQYSDVALIKRERRRQRKKAKRKYKWPKRKLQSRGFQRKGEDNAKHTR